MPTSQGVIIPMPAPTVDPSIKETLGSKVSTIMQTYNDMKAALRDQPEATRAQFDALLEKRRAAVEAIFAAHKGTLDLLLGPSQAKLSGIGATTEVSTIQTQLDSEQSKLAALSAYFEAYKSAIASGSAPPAIPTELQEGSFGISATTLAILAALGAAAWFWWTNKD